MVGRPAAAEHDPVVRGPLAVDEEVPEVGEGLPPGQPDLGPGRGGERLGGDHQRVDGDARPAVPGQLRGEPLGGPDHRPGAHHAVLGAHLARGDGRDPGPLVDRHAAAFGRPGQPAHQSRRMDGRAVGGVRRARDAVGAHDPGRLRGVEERQVVRVPAPVPRLLDLGPGARELGGAAGQPDRPALGDVRVDALGPRRPGRPRRRSRASRRAGRARPPGRPAPRGRAAPRGTVPSTSPRCARRRRSRPPRTRARRRTATGPPRPGSRRPRARCSRRRPRPRRRRGRPAGTVAASSPRRRCRARTTGRRTTAAALSGLPTSRSACAA